MNSILNQNKSYKITKIVNLNNKKIKLIFYIPKIISVYKDNDLIINYPTFLPLTNYNLCFINNKIIYYPKYYTSLSFNVINKMYCDNNYLFYNTLIEEYYPEKIKNKKYSYNFLSFYSNPIKTPNIFKSNSFNINEQPKNINKSNKSNDLNNINFNMNSKPFIPNKNKNKNILNNVNFNINSKPFNPNKNKNNFNNEFDINSKIFIPKNKINNDINNQNIISKNKKIIKRPIKKYIYDKNLNIFVPTDYNLKKSKTPTLHLNKSPLLFKF